jgi:carboxyl-terminal processing protease
MPDVFVPFDTTSQPDQLLSLYRKGTLNTFLYEYYIENKSWLQKFRTPGDVYKQFHPGEKEWQELTAYAKKDTIDLSAISPVAKNDLLKRFQALLARQIWRTEGYYEISNQTDPMVKKALEIMK